MLFAHRGADTDAVADATTASTAWTADAAGLQAAASLKPSAVQLKRMAQKVGLAVVRRLGCRLLGIFFPSVKRLPC